MVLDDLDFGQSRDELFDLNLTASGTIPGLTKKRAELEIAVILLAEVRPLSTMSSPARGLDRMLIFC